MIWNDGQWESPDPLADRARDEDDCYADSLDDEAFERDARAVWDVQHGRWIDA